MIVLYGEASNSRNAGDRLRGDIIAAAKAVVSLSILTRMNALKAANGFH
jgi:hypothetical protein